MLPTIENVENTMRKPDFFLVGAAKAGTTSLFNYLVQHPSIFVPPMKEPHYFSDYSHIGAPKLRSLNEYLHLFEGCRADQIAGDLSTSSLHSPRAAGRIHELQPEAKIVMVLRNPIDRAYSFYWYNRNHFVEDLDFESALDREAARIAGGANFRFHYVESGKYAAQVERYLDAFGADAVRIYLFEDLMRDTQGLCTEILSFLGLRWDPSIRTGDVFNRSGVFKSNLLGRLLTQRIPGKAFLRRLAPRGSRYVKNRLFDLNTSRPPQLSASTRARLVDAFAEDIDRVSGILDRDLSHWIAKHRTPSVSAAAVPEGAARPGA
jgi:hypothetical protein